MNRSLPFLALVLSCLSMPAFSETWTLSTGVKVVSATGPIHENTNQSLSIQTSADGLVFSLIDVFHSAGEFEEPWLSLDTYKRSTLHIKTKEKSSWFFSNKEEYARSVKVKVSKERLEPGTTVYLYNGDTGEVVGHMLVPQ